MKPKRTVSWVICLVLAIPVLLYAELIREMSTYDPFFLVPCVDQEAAWRAWTCKQVLRYGSLRPDQVAQLNRQGGALFPVLMKEPAAAEEMLTLFVERGVDINAGDRWFTAKGRTALQSMALDGKPDRIDMLLRHGARVDVRDAAGLTALDLARHMKTKFPNEPSRAKVVQLLERTQ
jgi:hypothetical protein